jgi:hypothetical protein
VEQHQLFEDLKKVRDRLTHPIPFGTEIEEEIVMQREIANGLIYTRSRPSSREKILKPNWLVSDKPVANFKPSPERLNREDAEQALEILLRHLMRLEDIFFEGRTSWFGFYDDSKNCLLSTEELLKTIKCRFEKVWR